MVKRITAREFQRSFQKQVEPVVVGHGIWFPEATAELIAIAEGPPLYVMTTTGSTGSRETTITEAPSVRIKRLDFSKTAQAKGKMGR